MNFDISQRFHFEAAHTLVRQTEAAASRRIHGHTYLAEVTVRGPRDSNSGMVVDLGLLRQEIEKLRAVLDHSFLDEISDLGAPTLENLSAFIATRLRHLHPRVSSVRVWREAIGDSCLLRIDDREHIY